MKSAVLRFISTILLFTLLFPVFPIDAFAASIEREVVELSEDGLYSTTKSGVPVWSEASSSSTLKYRIADKGTVVRVISSKTNKANNLWFQIEDGNWIFSENISKSSNKTFSTPLLYETTKGSVPVWSAPSSSSTLKYRVDYEETIVYVISHRINESGNLWHQLSDGWVFSGNVSKHKCVGAMCGLEKTSYEYIDEQTHKRVGTMDELCVCSAVVDTDTNIKIEQHSFLGTDSLCACGYKKPEGHVHEYNNGVCKCGVQQPHTHVAVACGAEDISYTLNNATTHIIIRSIPHICSCGFELGKEQKTETVAHTFSETGKCQLCGYQKHICIASSGGENSVSYEKSSEDSHVKVIRTTDTICKCGSVVLKGTTKLEAEKHIFESNDVCKNCGYKKHVCKPLFQPETEIHYEKSDINAHLKVIETTATVCSCGATLSQAQQDKQVELHSFLNSKCACGYAVPNEEHIHEGIKCGTPFYTYSPKDSDFHTKIEKVPNICSCEATVDFSSIETDEEHTFVERVCTSCGFKQETGVFDVDPGQIAEQAVLGNYSDSVTIAGLVTEVIVGEIPICGTAADIRDVVADIQQGAGFVPTLIDAAALIPFVGVLKYADEAVDALKSTSKVSDAVDGKSITYLRQKAVKDAWQLEVENVTVKKGTGVSRVWNNEQIAELKATGKVAGFEGHHMKNVWMHPDLAGKAENIQFLTRREHFAAHCNDWHTVTTGYFDYTKMKDAS